MARHLHGASDRAAPRRSGRSGPIRLAGSELPGEVRRRAGRGERITRLSVERIDEQLVHEVAFSRCPGAPRQEVDVDVGVTQLTSRIAARASEGLHVALIAAHGGPDDGHFAIVYEPAPDAGPPRWVAPSSFRDDAGVFFLHRALTPRDVEAFYVRAVAALGTPSDELGRGLVVVAALWPQPDVRIGAAVHLDPVAQGTRWELSDTFAVLATTGEPVATQTIADGAQAWVLSLWHDTRHRAWSSDPMPLAERPTPRRTHAAARADTVMPRRFVTRDRGRAGPDTVDATCPPWPASSSRLDAWVSARMRAIGARHAQLVVTKGDSTVVDRAFTFAEEGYPIATTDTAFRLGSVSKPITVLTLASALARHGAHLLDEPISSPAWLDADARVAASMPRITPRDLASHRAGLRAFADLGPDQPDNPLSEDRIVEHLGRPGGFASPGDLSAALSHVDLADAFCLARRPLDGFAYANEGYVLLGELVGRLATGRPDGFEEAVLQLFGERAADFDVGAARARGLMLGRGQREARRRQESPAHPAFPTWGESRFTPSEAELVPSPYLDNGPFLGGAAGLSMPLGWVAELLLGLHREGGAPFRFACEHLGWDGAAAEPLGFRRSGGYWTTGRGSFRERAHRVVRLHHDGRMDGGSALLVHQAPLDPGADEARITVAVAFNQLGSLTFERDGMELLDLVAEWDGGDRPHA